MASCTMFLPRFDHISLCETLVPTSSAASATLAGITGAARNHDSLFVEIDQNVVCDEDVQRDVSRTLTLNAALSRVGDRCRNVLERYYLESESTATIAEAIGTTPGNVLYILHTCRKRARAFLGEMDPKR